MLLRVSFISIYKLTHTEWKKNNEHLLTAQNPVAMKKLELEIVYLLNKWIGALAIHKGDQDHVRLNQRFDGSYEIVDCSLNDLRKVLDSDHCKVWFVDSAVLNKWMQHAVHEEGDYYVAPMTKEGLVSLPSIGLIRKNLIDIWHDSGHRKEYSNKCFNPRPPSPKHPQGAFPKELNMFPGMGITREDCQDYTDWTVLTGIINHSRFVLCRTDEEFYHFLGMEAISLQEPWYRHGIATCIGGDEGVGKTSFYANLMSPIYGQNFLIAHDVKDVIGDYTSLVQNKLLVVLDEISMLRREEQNKLKNEITSDIGRNRKMYQETEMKENYRRYILISNTLEGFVPAGASSRRFFVLHADPTSFLDYLSLALNKVSMRILQSIAARANARLNLLDYNKIVWNYQSPTLVVKTFANLLYNLQLIAFKPREFPVTDLLFEQKMACMNPLDRFIINFLQTGRISISGTDGQPVVLGELDAKLVSTHHVTIFYWDYQGFLDRVDPKNKKSNSFTEVEFAQKFKDRFGGAVSLFTDRTSRLVKQKTKVTAEYEEVAAFKMPGLEDLRKIIANQIPGCERMWRRDVTSMTVDAPDEDTSNDDPLHPSNRDKVFPPIDPNARVDPKKKQSMEMDAKCRMPHKIEWPIDPVTGKAEKHIVYDEEEIKNPWPETLFSPTYPMRKLMEPVNDADGNVSYGFDATIPNPTVYDRDSKSEEKDVDALEDIVYSHLKHLYENFLTVRAAPSPEEQLNRKRLRVEAAVPVNKTKD